MPKVGRIVVKKNNENIRVLMEGNYRIIYVPGDSERIEVQWFIILPGLKLIFKDFHFVQR